MKRRGFIAGVLVLSMLLMGTGYAYWTDKGTINSTVTTGEMNVKFVDLNLFGQYEEDGGWSIISGIPEGAGTTDHYFAQTTRNMNTLGDGIGDVHGSTGYRALLEKWSDTTFDAKYPDGAIKELMGSGNQFGFAENTVLSDKIEIDITNMYPGYAQIFKTDVANIGTITAKLAAITAKSDALSDEVADDITDVIGVSLNVMREYAGTEGHVNVFDGLESEANCFTVGGVKFVRLSELTDLYTSFEHSDLYVKPDDNRMDVYLAIAMDPDYAGEYTTGHVDTLEGDITSPTENDSLTEEKTVNNITIEFLWDQFNTGYLEAGGAGSGLTNNRLSELQHLPQ